MGIGNAGDIWRKWDTMKRTMKSAINVDLMVRSSGTCPRKRMERRVTTSNGIDFKSNLYDVRAERRSAQGIATSAY